MLTDLASVVSPSVLTLILKYKYLILFPILVFEGPIITLVAGALATPQAAVFNVFTLYVFVVVADLIGDTFYYLLGKHFGSKILNHISKRRNVDYHGKIKRYFDKHGSYTLMIGKISHGFGWPVMMFAGSIHMKYGRFMLFNFIVSCVKSAVLIAIGYYYATYFNDIVGYLGTLSTIITTVAVALVVIYIYNREDFMK